MKYKFSQAEWQEWQHNPETWWQEHNIDLTKEQEEWFNNPASRRLSYDDFQESVRQSQMFTGFFDWS